MATNLVNLDALLPREDFDVSDEVQSFLTKATISVPDLETTAFFYLVLRKPDFQRETANWSPQKICDFVCSFLNGDLIPAIILWQSKSNVFVIDGSHRLSALIAWIQDDYGDGVISGKFFEQRIPAEQKKNAEKTRKLIQQAVGTYQSHKASSLNAAAPQTPLQERAKRLGSLAISLQWITGSAQKAENSFFKINQEAVPIDKTELRILQSRRLPNAISARAIVRSGTGHKYWAKFEEQERKEIENIAREINDCLFVPELSTPIKTLDLPVAGKGYSAQTLPLIFDLVNLSNEITPEKIRPTRVEKILARLTDELKEDADGKETIAFLKKTRKVVWRISSQHASSLGLHPFIYFYGKNGRYQQTSFMAVVSLIKDFERENYYHEFIRLRRDFEDFILKYKTFSNQITVQLGSGVRGYIRLKQLFRFILEGLSETKRAPAIIDSIRSNENFKFLSTSDPIQTETSEDFTTEVKSEAFLKTALENPPVRCSICGGFIHKNSMTVDHVLPKVQGGKGGVENAQLAHPFCNSTVKGPNSSETSEDDTSRTTSSSKEPSS